MPTDISSVAAATRRHEADGVLGELDAEDRGAAGAFPLDPAEP